ncbi:MAG: hypothetical protein KatS3mg077_0314 [Candidatus Binatia bacterium]|nr:MAG: hypothetical protein KatS3mg077_0314 [Candidatus Binatia bacterium]
MDHLHFLFAAYTAVWAMLFLYLWLMSRRTRRLEEQLEELQRLLEKLHRPATGEQTNHSRSTSPFEAR